MLYSARLRSSLPQMVVDVLEEKMEQEYRNGALSLLKHINSAPVLSKCDGDDHDDDQDDDVRNPIVSRFFRFWYIFSEFGIKVCQFYIEYFFRMTSCLETLEMLKNLKHGREM